MTIQERITAAHKRAVDRYSLTYTITNGAEAIPFSAIKRLMPSQEQETGFGYSTNGTGVNVRRAELVLTRETFNRIVARLNQCNNSEETSAPTARGLSSPSGSSNRPPGLRDATITELNVDGATNDWKIDAREPFVENDPTGATVRIFIYQRTKAL